LLGPIWVLGGKKLELWVVFGACNCAEWPSD